LRPITPPAGASGRRPRRGKSVLAAGLVSTVAHHIYFGLRAPIAQQPPVHAVRAKPFIFPMRFRFELTSRSLLICSGSNFLPPRCGM
jgi:hypothetical protein